MILQRIKFDVMTLHLQPHQLTHGHRLKKYKLAITICRTKYLDIASAVSNITHHNF